MKGCRALTEAEVNGILADMGTRDRLLMMTGLYFGTRISESLSLTFGNVAGEYLYIRSAKGSDNAAFPIPTEYRQTVAALRAEYVSRGIEVNDHTPVFLSKHGVAMSRQAVGQIIKATCEKLGIGGKVSTHSLRKTFVTKIYNMTGFDIAQTKVYSRHKNIGNLDYYINTTKDTGLVLSLNWGSK